MGKNKDVYQTFRDAMIQRVKDEKQIPTLKNLQKYSEKLPTHSIGETYTTWAQMIVNVLNQYGHKASYNTQDDNSLEINLSKNNLISINYKQPRSLLSEVGIYLNGELISQENIPDAIMGIIKQ